jgi:hypothetical protein
MHVTRFSKNASRFILLIVPYIDVSLAALDLCQCHFWDAIREIIMARLFARQPIIVLSTEPFEARQIARRIIGRKRSADVRKVRLIEGAEPPPAQLSDPETEGLRL